MGEEPAEIRVVVADDHPIYIHGIRMMFDSLSDDLKVVGEATDGVEVIDVVAATSPDILLMDLRMPRLGGLEAGQKIRELYPHVKVIILTVSTDTSDVHAAVAYGVQGYLSKETSPQQLMAAVRAVHAGEIVMAPFAASASFTNGPGLAALKDAEIRLLRLIADGSDYEEIGRELAVSESTVKRMLHDIERKLGVTNRTQALIVAAKRGIL